MSPHRFLLPVIPPGKPAIALGWAAIVVAIVGPILIAINYIRANERNHDASREDRADLHAEQARGVESRAVLKSDQDAMGESVMAGRAEIMRALERIEGKVDRLGAGRTGEGRGRGEGP